MFSCLFRYQAVQSQVSAHAFPANFTGFFIKVTFSLYS